MATRKLPADHPTPVSSGRELLRLENVNKHFGELHVLRNVSLTVNRGDVVVVLGPSGSGKTTMCRTINRLETIDSGTISLNGTVLPEEGKELARYRARVGMVFQSFNLFSHMSIVENVALGPWKVKGLSKENAFSRAREMLDRVGIANQSRKMPAQLSGGQQQRCAIARALAMDPEMILFDEPTSALDPETIHEVLNVMRELGQSGMTMLVVTHEMGFAKSVADRVVFMSNGQILEEGLTHEFLANPRSEEARRFVASILTH